MGTEEPLRGIWLREIPRGIRIPKLIFEYISKIRSKYYTGIANLQFKQVIKPVLPVSSKTFENAFFNSPLKKLHILTIGTT